MLLREPIFLNCFSRGGSNILWNIFLSHPKCTSPILETLELFRFDWRAPTRAGLKVALLSRQPRLFDQWSLRPRRRLTPGARAYIDEVLHRERAKTFADRDMRFKQPELPYSRAEIEDTRLVAKNNNGLAFLAAHFRQMYPGARFFALIRDPVALYESHLRHRISSSPDDFSRFFNRLADRIVRDATEIEEYHLVWFDDVVARPVETAFLLFETAGLPCENIGHLRFKSKAHFRPDGTHTAPWQKGVHRWFTLTEVASYFEPGIDELQIERLAPRDRDRVLVLTRDSTRALRRFPAVR